MNNTYYLMRHGESQANKADMIISAPENGCKLYGLTKLGRQQAEDSARASGLDAKTIILTSDFARTRETAKIAAKTIGATQVINSEGLRERYFGQLEGTSGDGYKKVWAQDEIQPDAPILGAESTRHLTLRVKRVLEKLETEYEEQTILLVSHGDTLRFLQLWAAGRPLTEHLGIALFKPAEVRRIDDLPKP